MEQTSTICHRCYRYKSIIASLISYLEKKGLNYLIKFNQLNYFRRMLLAHTSIYIYFFYTRALSFTIISFKYVVEFRYNDKLKMFKPFSTSCCCICLFIKEWTKVWNYFSISLFPFIFMFGWLGTYIEFI